MNTAAAAAGHASTVRSPGLLGHYEAVEQASADMLGAARRGDWEQFDRLKGACGQLIEQLRQAAQTQPLAPELHKARMHILHRIVLIDAQIRRLAEPWTDRLGALLVASPRTVH